jgi:hypothetical protein
VDTTAPVDVSNWTVQNSGNAVSPSLTTAAASEWLINAVAFTGVNTGDTITPNTGFTERFDYETKPITSDYADAIQASAGSTGTKTAVPSGPDNGWVSTLIALKPAPASGVNGISVNYWVVAVDRNSLGAYREGPASNVVDAYAPDLAPYPIAGSLTCTSNADGSSTLSWTQPAQPNDPDAGDHIAFDRIYRDGSRFDTTGLETDDSFTDPNPGGTHTYYVTTVDTHLMESTPTGTVTC